MKRLVQPTSPSRAQARPPRLLTICVLFHAVRRDSHQPGSVHAVEDFQREVFDAPLQPHGRFGVEVL